MLEHGAWRYTCVVADVLRGFGLGPDAEWVPVGEVHARQLHPSFAGVWLRLLRVIYPSLIGPGGQLPGDQQGDQGVVQGKEDDGGKGVNQGNVPNSAQVLDEDDDEDVLSKGVGQKFYQKDSQNANQQDSQQVNQSNDPIEAEVDDDKSEEVVLLDEASVGPINQGLAQKDNQEVPAAQQDGQDDASAGQQFGAEEYTWIEYYALAAMYHLNVPEAYYSEILAYIKELVGMDMEDVVEWAKDRLWLTLNPMDDAPQLLRGIIIKIWDAYKDEEDAAKEKDAEVEDEGEEDEEEEDSS